MDRLRMRQSFANQARFAQVSSRVEVSSAVHVEL